MCPSQAPPHAGGGSHPGLQDARLKEQGRTSLPTREVRAPGSSSCPNDPKSHLHRCSQKPSPAPRCSRSTETGLRSPPAVRVSHGCRCAPRGCVGRGSDPSPDAREEPEESRHLHRGVLERAGACVGCTGVVQLAGQRRRDLSSAMFLLDVGFTKVTSFIVVKSIKTSPRNVSKPIKNKKQSIALSYLLWLFTQFSKI